jgi:hypothetical protein
VPCRIAAAWRFASSTWSAEKVIVTGGSGASCSRDGLSSRGMKSIKKKATSAYVANEEDMRPQGPLLIRTSYGTVVIDFLGGSEAIQQFIPVRVDDIGGEEQQQLLCC